MGGWFAVAAGLFCLIAAYCDWDLFMNNHRARLFVSLFGRNGARAVYGLIGAAFLIFGLLFATGVIKEREGARRAEVAAPVVSTRSA